MQALMRRQRDPKELLAMLYLSILSRYPTPDEGKAIAAHAQTASAKGQAAFVDLAWALINSTEFLYRH